MKYPKRMLFFVLAQAAVAVQMNRLCSSNSSRCDREEMMKHGCHYVRALYRSSTVDVVVLAAFL